MTIPQARHWFKETGDAITDTAFYMAIKRGVLPVVRMSEHCYLVRRADLQAWKARRAVRAARRQAKLAAIEATNA
jgi:hypothetical protein